MTKRLTRLLMALTVSAVPTVAAACGNGAVLFTENFETPDAGWTHADTYKMGDGVLTMLPPINGTTVVLNNTYIFNEADVCAQIKVVDFIKGNELKAGLEPFRKVVESDESVVIQGAMGGHRACGQKNTVAPQIVEGFGIRAI